MTALTLALIVSTSSGGFGTRPRNQPVDSWLERFGDWLRSQKLSK
jgi:hypothetical protein